MSNNTKREKVKRKILWYCNKLGIDKPKSWGLTDVKKVALEINKSSSIILCCTKCLKVDISYTHKCNF